MTIKKTLLFVLPLIMANGCTETKDIDRTREKTTFQVANPWRPTLDNRADVAIIYGTNTSEGIEFEERAESWKEKGYKTHFMTGIAWGNYGDYYSGKWDGKEHFDEAQVVENGDTLWHGRPVPYLVPSDNFLEYFKETQIKRVIDAGIDAIYLEEPEFWARAGYSDAFKKEWEKYYGFPWRPQHESAENTYLSNKLKYHLYYNAINQACTYAKEYGKSKGMDVRCYIPTHSLVNYSSWQIVSPEASLASLPCIDGYIAQVWTGTSRTATYFNGQCKERVFENAYLEYGSMESMTEPTGRKLFFLTDPIEDYPRDWDDYKKNYQATFTAELLYPKIANYEVMPWPDRIYEGKYLNPATGQKEKIPTFYSTQIQVIINSLNMMPISENKVSGSQGISIMMSNSLMFQRSPNSFGYEDPDFSCFYGQTFPLVKRGVPVKTLHIENTGYSECWKDTKLLIMSYTNMKPLDPEAHSDICEWVSNGGTLLYCGTDKDPYQNVQEWWNQNGNNYERPSDHLFDIMGIGISPSEGTYSVGKGTVRILREEPKDFVINQGGDKKYIKAVEELYNDYAKAGKLEFKNNFYLRRGPFEIISVMDESVSDENFRTEEGLYIDLFDPEIPILTSKSVAPGEQAYLLNLNELEKNQTPQIVASASRIEEETISRKSYSFLAKGPVETTSVIRMLLKKEPKEIKACTPDGKEVNIFCSSWDEKSKTYFIKFQNSPDGVRFNLRIR